MSWQDKPNCPGVWCFGNSKNIRGAAVIVTEQEVVDHCSYMATKWFFVGPVPALPQKTDAEILAGVRELAQRWKKTAHSPISSEMTMRDVCELVKP